jgi:ankyrin repeat protein
MNTYSKETTAKEIQMLKDINTCNITIADLKQYSKSGVNMNCVHDGTPLQLALYWELDSIVKTLLQLGADPNKEYLDVVNKNGFTDAIARASGGGFICLKDFVEIGNADVNHCFDDGTTPLMLSCDGEVSMVKYLVTCGADVHAKDIEGSTALKVALQREDTDCEIIDYLLSFEPNEQNLSGLEHLSKIMKDLDIEEYECEE